MPQVKFLKPCAPYNVGEVAELSEPSAKDAVEKGIAEVYKAEPEKPSKKKDVE